MTTSDYPAAEEAIDALLREHAPAITGDPEEAEAETQFQTLQRELGVLEASLIVLREARRTTVKANFDSQARTFDLRGRDQGLKERNGPLYGTSTGAAHRAPTYNLVARRLGLRIFVSGDKLDSAAAFEAPDRLDWRRNQVGSIAEEGGSIAMVPRSQALRILGWCEETIERIATTLTPEQIHQIFKAEDPGIGPPWSAFTTGRIILRDRLQQRILPLENQKQQWNEQLPIARLPVEILIQVFGFVLGAGPPPRDETFTLCIILIRICRDWTRIIQNTPTLWGRISPYSSSSCQVMMALNKSRPCPLSVWFNRAEMRHITLDHFLRSITQHVDRLEVLEMSLDSLGILNGWFAEVFPPRLRRLRVSRVWQPNRFGSTSSTRIESFGGRWPSSLKHFGIVGCGINPSHYAELRGLTILEISRLPSGQEVGVDEILHILSNCPEIESLTLSGRIVVAREPTLLNPGLPVRFDRLREISLSLEPAPMNYLLRSIQIGSCAKFCIEAMRPPESTSAWTDSLLTRGIQPFVPVLNSILSSASAISIEVDRESLKLSTGPPESDSVVCLTFHGTGLAEVGRWMANSLTLGPAPATLYFAAKEPEEPTWIESLPLILSNFNHIVELTFVGLGTAYQQAIDFLGTPIHTEATGHQHFPAPRLACMDVADQYIPNIIHMVERRQSAEISGVGRPVTLSRLKLRRTLDSESPGHETLRRRLSDLAGGEVELLIF